jgi:predicted nucleic acid-binding protein
VEGTFIDTNIFLRHLLNDVPAQSTACHDLFRAIENQDLIAWTTPVVVAEIVFVLSNPRTYGFDRASLRDLVLSIVQLTGLRLESKHLYPRVFDLFVSHPIDYVDAYHAAMIENAGQTILYSYDGDFDAVPSLERKEP